MFKRTRIAFTVAFVGLLLTTLVAGAKGGFDFLTITGPDLDEPVRLEHYALVTDFFAFANFFEDRTTAPEDPGPGYEITRHYTEGNGDVIFDRLHYYPESGFVFYDGIENGDSEYDAEWYTANPDIRPVFESALARQLRLAAPVEKKEPVAAQEKQPVAPVSESRPADTAVEVRPVGWILPSLVLLSVGLATLLAFTYRRRKPASS